jgi:hypothetical protein
MTTTQRSGSIPHARSDSTTEASQRKRQIDRAIEDYDEAIRLNPASAVAFDNRPLRGRSRGRPILRLSTATKRSGLSRPHRGVLRASRRREPGAVGIRAYLADGADGECATGMTASAFSQCRRVPRMRFPSCEKPAVRSCATDFDEAIRVDPTVAAASSGRAHALRFVGHMTGPVADDRKARTLALDERSWSREGVKTARRRAGRGKRFKAVVPELSC